MLERAGSPLRPELPSIVEAKDTHGDAQRMSPVKRKDGERMAKDLGAVKPIVAALEPPPPKKTPGKRGQCLIERRGVLALSFHMENRSPEQWRTRIRRLLIQSLKGSYKIAVWLQSEF
ncbi:MAG: hypothetical protein Q9210_003081 [Variospora velana]